MPVSISIRIDAQVPCASSVKIWKRDRDVFPESIDCDIDQVIFSFFFIVSRKAHTEGTCISWNICFLCIQIMCMDRIHAADGCGQLFVDDRMLFAEGNHKFKEFKQIFVLFEHTPVQPGSNVVLAVAVVVSEFGIPKFITGKKHWCAAAAHKDSTGIPDHTAAK